VGFRVAIGPVIRVDVNTGVGLMVAIGRGVEGGDGFGVGVNFGVDFDVGVDKVAEGIGETLLLVN